MSPPLKNAVPTWSDIVRVITGYDRSDVRIKTIDLRKANEHVVLKSELYIVRVILTAYCRAIIWGTREDERIIVKNI